MNRILLVEDDEALCTGIAMALGTPEVRLTACRTLAAARAALAGQSFELLILDVNLPDGSALDLVRGLRPRDPVPVLLLTANDLEVDIVNGLEAGADDYVTKPFSLAVLRARVAALLRRGRARPAPVYRQDGLVFDFAAPAFWREGEPLTLSPTEQRLLRLLVENRGCTLPRSLLLERVWGCTWPGRSPAPRAATCGCAAPRGRGASSRCFCPGRPRRRKIFPDCKICSRPFRHAVRPLKE